jgi:tetratricopeptide (TPR) repeat protein
MSDITNSRLKRKMGWRPFLRISLALLGLFCCYHLIVDAATSGASRLFSTLAIVQSRLEPADAAVRLTPGDPEAHYTRALTLVNLGRLGDAVAELEQTTRLRPHHYYEWLDLGVTLDRLGDRTAAAAALEESVRLAPAFAQPRWQLGNLFFRQERYQEAFAELRLGAKSNPVFFKGMLDLAWVAADGDVGMVENLVKPQSGRDYLEYGIFLIRQGKASEGARQARNAGKPKDESDAVLLREIISELLQARQFSDAHAVWAADHGRSDSNGTAVSGPFLNGDFVEPIIQNDPGFGWQLVVVPNLDASIDPSGPNPGARSLRLEFGGNSDPGSKLIHQLVLVQPNSHYSLRFMAKTEDLVSGGPPVILALAADNEPAKTIGVSKSISTGTSGWSAYEMDFSTDEKTGVVDIALQRLSCVQNPCPIFGKLWLSGFSLRKN